LILKRNRLNGKRRASGINRIEGQTAELAIVAGHGIATDRIPPTGRLKVFTPASASSGILH
jgi:hypothetical protein